MNSRYDYLLFVYFLILPSLFHPSILINCFLYLFLFFFYCTCVIYQCHLLSSVIKWKLNGSGVKIRTAATPLINLRSYAYNTIPYSGKLSRVLIFAVFADQGESAKFIPLKFLNLTTTST